MSRLILTAAVLPSAALAFTGAGLAQPAPAAQPPAATAAVPAQYRIGPDDTLDITVFQVPELTRTVQVDASGQFILPLVGRVQAAGHTADEISALLTEKLQGRYLNDPLITVMVKQAVSQRVTVDGAVIKPGVYNLNGPTTLLQALALANGPDPKVANLRKVAIFRSEGGERHGRVYDLARIRQGKAPDPEVQADDIVVVDASGTRSFFAYYGSSLPILNLLRPY
jgi:polysaccharide export outer membrane protein